jgi:hypothetical protein
MGFETKIQHSHLLTDIFGRWPSFHDAEVLRILLDRDESKLVGPSLEAKIHVFEMTSEVDERNRYVLKNHVAVTIRFIEIYNLSMKDFNHQNVLQGLNIDDISDPQFERIKFEVSFDGIFGISVRLQCNSISVVSVEPYVRG